MTLTVEIQDPVSGTWLILLQGAALATTGLRTYLVYPGVGVASAGVTGVESRPLPRMWRVTVTHATADSYTYSVGAALIL